jgi:hypothetical protein
MKLIASDLDGTLLNEMGEVSERNAVAIQRATEHGFTFVVATGRSWQAASKPLEAAGLTCPVISLNGAVIYDENQHEIDSVTMDKAVAKQVLSFCREKDMYLEFFTNKGIFSVSREYFLEVMIDIMKSANPKLTEEEIRKQAHLRFQMEPVTFIESYDEIFEIENLSIYKILGFSLEPKILKQVRAEFEDTSGVALTSSGDINLEFNHPNAQKGVALQKLADQLGFAMKDTIALGDNWNDVSMLQAAGRGIAMGNATDAIKQIADEVTESNMNDGVASIIEDALQRVGKQ